MYGNMGNMMKQVKMQKQMAKLQEELEAHLEVTSGGGMVRVEVNGKKELVDLEVDPQR